MSPEQATADKEITGRSDIYSLASVLYEMLAGQPPHLGGSAQQIIMKIIAESPQPVTALRKSVPPNVAAAIARALEKLPADRFPGAQAFAEALKNTAFTLPSMAASTVTASGERWKLRAAVPLAIAAMLLLVLAAWGWLRPEPTASVARFDLDPGAATPTPGSDIVISPDGSLIAFTGVVGNDAPALYVRRLDGDPDFRKIPGTEGANSAAPAFSPDSRSIAFRRPNNALVKLDLSGAGATVIANLGTEIGAYVHWGTPDQMVYSGGPRGLFRVSAAGGPPEFLHKTVGAQRHSFLLPDGSGVLYSTSAQGVMVLDFRSDSAALLVPNAIHPTYIATGHLLYIGQEGGLFAIPFDLRSHRITGTAAKVLDRVAAGTGRRGYSVSQQGILVYHEGASTFGAEATLTNALAVVDFSGVARRIELPAASRTMPRFSPSGDRIAFVNRSNRDGVARDIHVLDLASGTDTRLTFDGDNEDPIWSPDGKTILFTRSVGDDRRDLFIKPADNSSAERSVLAMPGWQSPDSWLKDGTILFSSAAQGGLFKLFSIRDSAPPRALLEGPTYERDISLSPDGRYAVYGSSNQGDVSLWITDYPAAKGKWQVTQMAGVAPRWSRDGFVYFWKTASAAMDSLFRARIDLAPTVVVRATEFVLALPISQTTRNWDLHPDGKRFVTSIREAPNAGQGGATPTSRYLIAVNWFAELKRRTERQ
jgi:serine/threonine-protein kinase